MAIVAESPLGVRTASHRGPSLGRGIPVRLWRCPGCGCDAYEGWLPPTWISAVAQRAEEIGRELAANLISKGEIRWDVRAGRQIE
jgi:hypothetical protein